MSRGGHDSGQNHQHIGQHQGAAAIKSCSATPTHPLHRTGRYPLPPARRGARVRWRAQGIRRERCAVGRTKKSARLAQKRSVVAASQPVAASQEERALAAAVGRRWGLCAGTAPDSAGCCRLILDGMSAHATNEEPGRPTRDAAAHPGSHSVHDPHQATTQATPSDRTGSSATCMARCMHQTARTGRRA